MPIVTKFLYLHQITYNDSDRETSTTLRSSNRRQSGWEMAVLQERRDYKWGVQTAFRYACRHNSLFPKSHTLFVSHFNPRWRWVRDGSQWWWKAHCYQWMNQFFVFVCMFMSTFVRIRGTSVWYIASDLYSPGVTRDQLCWLIDAKSTSQTKYLGHFSHISAISCTHISITSDDLMIFAVDKKQNKSEI